MKKQILFIHRSVGENLIIDGNIYQKLRPNINIDFYDYNVNTKILRSKKSTNKIILEFPNNNTAPKDYAVIFNKNTKYIKTLNYITKFNTIIIKSCYPNSNIKSIQELNNIKNYYTQISNFFYTVTNKLIIVTSPPLVPFKTNHQNANIARNLSNWLTRNNFANNISTFNLFDQLAELEGKNVNMLKKQYRRVLPLDSHPNKHANKTIAPKFIEFVISDSISNI